jgi:hypothetical protein
LLQIFQTTLCMARPRIQDLPDEQQGTKRHLTLTLGCPSERERGEMEDYPGPWEEAPEEEGRPERGLRRPEEQQTAVAAAGPREGHEVERGRRGG